MVKFDEYIRRLKRKKKKKDQPGTLIPVRKDLSNTQTLTTTTETDSSSKE